MGGGGDGCEIMRLNLLRRERLGKDRHLVQSAIEEIAGCVGDAAAADVKIITVAAVARRGGEIGGALDLAIGIKSHVGAIPHHGDVVPFIVRERIDDVQCITGRVNPAMQILISAITEFHQIILSK